MLIYIAATIDICLFYL